MMNNNESPTQGKHLPHEDADELMQQLQQLWDQRDAQLASDLAQFSPIEVTAKNNLWWRYAAAAAVVLLVVGGLVWLRPDNTQSEPLLAVAHPLQLVTYTEMTHTAAVEGPSLATATHKVQPQAKVQPHVANRANVVPSAAALDQTEVGLESEMELMGIPTDESFVTATFGDAEQQTYVRCNNLCDARDIINQAKEVL